MTKKNHTDHAALRTAAEDAVTSWRLLDAEATARRDTLRGYVSELNEQQQQRLNSTFSRSNPQMLRERELARHALEAEDAADRQRHVAVLALDAVELADGLAESDDLAETRDPRRLRDDMLSLESQEKDFLDRLADLRRQRDERVTGAFRADAAHAARRVAAGLPPSHPLPRPMFGQSYTKVLSERVEKGVPVPSKAARIEAIRAEENRIMADLEEDRLEKAAHDKEIADRKRLKEQAEEDDRRRAHARAQEQNDARDAATSRREKLAEDYRARQGASS